MSQLIFIPSAGGTYTWANVLNPQFLFIEPPVIIGISHTITDHSARAWQLIPFMDSGVKALKSRDLLMITWQQFTKLINKRDDLLRSLDRDRSVEILMRFPWHFSKLLHNWKHNQLECFCNLPRWRNITSVTRSCWYFFPLRSPIWQIKHNDGVFVTLKTLFVNKICTWVSHWIFFAVTSQPHLIGKVTLVGKMTAKMWLFLHKITNRVGEKNNRK